MWQNPYIFLKEIIWFFFQKEILLFLSILNRPSLIERPSFYCWFRVFQYSLKTTSFKMMDEGKYFSITRLLGYSLAWHAFSTASCIYRILMLVLFEDRMMYFLLLVSLLFWCLMLDCNDFSPVKFHFCTYMNKLYRQNTKKSGLYRITYRSGTWHVQK